MNSASNRGINTVIGFVMLLLAAGSLTNPRLHAYYAAQGASDMTLYIAAAARAAVGIALIVGRGRRLALALRYGSVTLLALIVAAGVLLVTRHAAGDGNAPPGRPSAAIIACYTLAAWYGASAALFATAWAGRAGFLGDAMAAWSQSGYFTYATPAFLAVWIFIQSAACVALCTPQVRRAAVGLLCLVALATAGKTIAAGHDTHVGLQLFQAGLCAVLCFALPRPQVTVARKFVSIDGATLGCLGLAALLAISGIWNFLHPELNGQFERAGYPPHFGDFVGGVCLLAALLLCAPMTRRWALCGFAAFSIAGGVVGVMQGQAMDAPLTVVMVAVCVALLAATQPKPTMAQAGS
jgi:hypothetical protein